MTEPAMPKPGLHLIAGRAGAGKTRLLTEALAAHMRRGERAILLVPEQHTFEAERRVAEAAGGLFGVQVLSLERLSERLLQAAGNRRTFLTAQGVRMVVRRAALHRQEELRAFSRVARGPGFAAEVAALIAACKQACISPEMLLSAVDALPAGALLSDKLHDAALLYADVETYLNGRYLTEDDFYAAATALLPGSFVDGVPVYLDGLPAVTRQVFSFLEALLPVVQSMTVALTIDDGAPDADVFGPNAEAWDALRDMAARLHLPLFERRLTGRRAADPALSHLERRLFAYPDEPYGAAAPAITVFGANSRTAEVRAMCDAVLALARGGVRYRDMAVLVSDMDAYGGTLERVCAARGIPLFLDARRPVRDHAAARLLLCAVRTVAGGFSAPDLLDLIKTGYAGIAHEDTELFENHVLRYGVRHSRFLSPFTRGEQAAPAEAVRQATTGPLLALREGLARPAAGDKARACYDYLVALDVRGQLERRADSLLEAGRIPQAEEHAQVWNTLMALLEQIDAIMGAERMSRAEFLTVLEEGLSEASLGVIPDTSDALRLSPLSRAGGGGVHALFVLGCSEGLLPRDHGDDGLLNEAERDSLFALGLPRMRGASFLAAHERLMLYEALSRPSDRLYLFYPFTGESGELPPSPLIARIRAIFPRAAAGTDLLRTDALPSCEADALERLVAALRRQAEDGVLPPELPALQAHFLKSTPAFTRRILGMGRAAAGEMLPRPLAKALYGERLAMSASRLEQFNACPFRHFITYGLRAEERPEYRERPADLGAFYHEALNAVFRRAADEGLSARALTPAQQQALLDDVLPEVIAAHNNGVLLGSDRLRSVLFLLVETLRRSVAAIVRQLAAGAFDLDGTEVRFGEGCAFPPIELTTRDGRRALLHGVIDRVDRAEDVRRVIDYKTGGRALDFAAIADGLTLQLPLYLSAVIQAGGCGGGMYYMPVRVPPVADGEDEAAALAAAFRLRGLTLSQPRVIELTDAALAGETAAASDVVYGLRRRRDGTLSGPAADEAAFAGLLAAARNKAVSTLENMLDGVAAAAPAEGACVYCPHRSICRFDPRLPGCRTRRRRTLSQRAFFETL